MFIKILIAIIAILGSAGASYASPTFYALTNDKRLVTFTLDNLTAFKSDVPIRGSSRTINSSLSISGRRTACCMRSRAPGSIG